MPPKVTLYTREGCHLCEVAKEAMAPILNELKIPLEEIDVDTLPEKRECYGNHIPVIEIDGECAYQHRVPPLGFRRRIESAMS